MTVTSVDIPSKLLDEALRLTGLRTKKDVINIALRTLVQQGRQREGLAELLARPSDPFLSESELDREAAEQQ